MVLDDSVEEWFIGIRQGRIAFLSASGMPTHRERVRADGLLVLPGLIDPHVHLGLPMAGTTTSDTPATGTAAAVHGGVTTVIDFTLQREGQSLPDSLAQRRGEFEGCSHTDFAFHANTTWFPDDFEARLPEELAGLAARGCRSMKVFTCYSEIGYNIGEQALRCLLRESRRLGLQVLVHAESETIVSDATAGKLEAGETNPTDYPGSRPPRAEVEAIKWVIGLARDEGAPIYFVHVSTAEGARAILDARAGGGHPPVYLETCPQYLWLNEGCFAWAEGVQFLVAPPLRTESDNETLRRLLLDGDVDVVATDHCCFRRDQKRLPGKPFPELPKGLPGVETRLPLVHTLYRDGSSGALPEMMKALARNPARIMGLLPRKGSIRLGADADLVLFDPEARWILGAADLHTATDFSPYEGQTVYGRVRSVYLRGNRILQEGALAGEATGRYAERAAP